MATSTQRPPNVHNVQLGEILPTTCDVMKGRMRSINEKNVPARVSLEKFDVLHDMTYIDYARAWGRIFNIFIIMFRFDMCGNFGLGTEEYIG